MSATAAPLFPPPSASALRLRDRRFWAVLLLSLLFHGTIIVVVHKPPLENGEAASKLAGPLNVRILPKPEPEKSAEAPPPVQPPQRLMTAPRRTTRPALPEQPPIPPPPAPPVVTPPVPPPPQMTFEEMVAARRAQRDPTVSEHAEARAESERRMAGNRTDAILNRNLGTLKEDGTSGVFAVTNVGSRYGTFLFRGWKRENRAGWRETVEVDAGNGGDVELAIVRRMIELIRGHYQGDFTWESHRLGRVVKLSARPQDQQGLEEFMLKEFFKGR
jgi:hypothetical protein